MEPNREIEWPRPTVDQAIIASTKLSHNYGRVDLGEPVKRERLTDREAEDRLLNLANGIVNGEVTSHCDVARVIQGLGMLMGTLGGASMEIDLAAFRVSHAVLLKQETFREPQSSQ